MMPLHSCHTSPKILNAMSILANITWKIPCDIENDFGVANKNAASMSMLLSLYCLKEHQVSKIEGL